MTMTATGTATPSGGGTLSYSQPPVGRLFQVRPTPEVESPPIVAMFPGADLPFGFEWYNYPVTTSWQVDTVTAPGRVRGRVTQVQLSDTEEGRMYRLVNTVSFADGTIDARMMIIRCLKEIE